MESLQNNKTKSEKVVLTAYRILKILKMLIIEPRSTEDINDVFKNDPINSKALSNDMICLYINTLRNIGCDISRPTKSNGFKYVLNSNPYSFKISQKESLTMESILENFIKSNDWKVVIDVCYVLEKLKSFCSEDSNLNFFRIISDILKIGSGFIKKLDYYCQKEKTIILEYKSTTSEVKNIELTASKLFMENARLYLWGYNDELQEMQYLRVDRIKSVKVVSFEDRQRQKRKLRIARYKLINQDIDNFVADGYQKVISKEGSELVIEEPVYNKFKLIQKVMGYADECVFLEPEDIKEEILLTIKKVIEKYETKG